MNNVFFNKNKFDFIETFPPLGHPEHHFNKYPDHPWLKKINDIKEWLKNNLSDGDNYIINNDLTVSQIELGRVDIIKGVMLKKIPVQFRRLGFLCARNISLESMIGTPYISDYLDFSMNNLKNYIGMGADGVMQHLNVMNNKELNSWEGFTSSKKIVWPQDEWNEETSYELLLNSPNCLKEIIVNNKFANKMIDGSVKEFFGVSYVNIEWLENERIKRSKEIMEEGLSINIRCGNKRKL